MTCDELLAAVSEQYGVSPQKYCLDMRKQSEWGGGPEIVVLANELRRPIHVYELQESTSTSGAPGTPVNRDWQLRRIACFGSPKFDHCNTALHILSADSRFPDLSPGDQLPNGNHFLALFPATATPKSSPPPASTLGAQRRGGFVPRAELPVPISDSEGTISEAKEWPLTRISEAKGWLGQIFPRRRFFRNKAARYEAERPASNPPGSSPSCAANSTTTASAARKELPIWAFFSRRWGYLFY